MATVPTILFAGGGSGGHIFPNMAILERLREYRIAVSPHFLVSARPLDTRIVRKQGLPLTVVSGEPWGLRPDRLIRFVRAFRRGEQQVRQIIAGTKASALVATGGFVGGPAVLAAHKRGIPVVLVSLDAVPGRANRMLAAKATEVFSAYPTSDLPRAQTIGLPLRRVAVGGVHPAKARVQLGLRPDLETILVTAGSQGAATINRMMMELCTRTHARNVLAGSRWQVLHLSGVADQQAVRRAYETAGIRGRVEPFCNAMGMAWAAATLAISRAGAGSVAEAWANTVPTIFIPYPYHRDQHQRFNAQPLTSAGAALLLRDQIDPIENVNQLTGPILSLMGNENQRRKIRATLRASCPPDGAGIVARWLAMGLGMGWRPGQPQATIRPNLASGRS